MRWKVTKAVRRSDLPAPARHVMLTLADVAEVGTAEIPAQHTPSLAVLARETGLNESTVKRHLNALEKDGWLVRSRPTIEAARLHGERTRYRLTMPQGAEGTVEGAEEAQEGAQEAQTRAQTEPSPGRTQRPKKNSDLDQTEDRSNTSVEPTRLDVEQLCRLLADRMIGNGCRPPNITKRWRDAARLLLDVDGKTVAQVSAAINWSQDDEFWRANILSMPKLREKYDALQQAAKRTRASPRAATSDVKFAAHQALKEQIRNQERIALP